MISINDFLEFAELRLAQSGYAEVFQEAVDQGAPTLDALHTADAMIEPICQHSEPFFRVLRILAAEYEGRVP